jgi:UDP-glucose 4-epimerase
VKQRALITGGAGFIGSHVADAFVAAHWDVTVADNLSTGRRDNVPDAATFIDIDVTSPDAIRLVRDGQFDVICHLAAQIDVRKSVADPVHDAAINVLGTLNIVEAVRASGGAGRTRVIFSSTGGALYGDFVSPPHAESVVKEPQSPYGIAKLSAEYYLAYYARLHGLDTVALRYANVYGPRQDPHGEAGVVAIFCGRVLEGRPLTVFGDGKQTRDYVFVKDVARANLTAATGKLPPAGPLDARGFNIGTGIETSVLELARILIHAAKSTAAIEHAPARTGEQMRSALEVSKTAKLLGWQPSVPLEAGLAETYQWFGRQRATEATV